ncbi:ADC synthase [Lipomyces japonicus]|uniref:ADC synthase n=1 Tax=Lipomyces japonicus TaxID=56871 RepID=UPI0034CEAF61
MPRVLLVDSHDSFALNLAALLMRPEGTDALTAVQVDVIQADCLATASTAVFDGLLFTYDVIVIGPGPGSPLLQADTAGIERLWTEMHRRRKINHASNANDNMLKPPAVFGVCLGFQWLLMKYGVPIVRLPKPRHGIKSVLDITDAGYRSLYQGIPQDATVEVVRYHSLYADYDSATASDDIVPLAWSADVNEEGNKVLMAIKHRTLPHWAVQYHPESICSGFGPELIDNLFAHTAGYISNRRSVLSDHHLDEAILYPDFATFLQIHKTSPTFPPQFDFATANRLLATDFSTASSPRELFQHSIDLPAHVNTTDFVVQLCEKLFAHFGVFNLLDSAAMPGRWSYIGCTDGLPSRVIYYHPDKFVREHSADTLKPTIWHVGSIADVWDLLRYRMHVPFTHVRQHAAGPGGQDVHMTMADFKSAIKSSTDLPSFYGGFIGFVSYESGVMDGLQLDVSSESPAETPDIAMTFHRNTVAIDHELKRVFIHTFGRGGDNQDSLPDAAWAKTVAQLVLKLAAKSSSTTTTADPTPASGLWKAKKIDRVIKPEKSAYVRKIEQCQAHLAAGSSYELCLTAQTVIKEQISGPQSSSTSNTNTSTEFITDWSLFKQLRELNPAPHAAFIRTHESTLVGASPERFISWSDLRSECELRPIKGTVKKTDTMTMARAQEILQTEKEQAENLMIVDLIRHDVARFCDVVTVPQLMAVEEYHAVYHLVSVISGRHMKQASSSGSGNSAVVTGVDVLRGALPPGSMTGAPKRRSVELLQQLEDHRRRGVYSGVCGYWDVLGHGDWSVVIRSAFSVGGSETDVPREWRIGAGGAITALSDPIDEWNEMQTKLDSALRGFLKK